MKQAILITLLLLTGCTNQGLYESIQHDQYRLCNNEPTPSAQQKCKEKLMPYHEYERQRKEL